MDVFCRLVSVNLIASILAAILVCIACFLLGYQSNGLKTTSEAVAVQTGEASPGKADPTESAPSVDVAHLRQMIAAERQGRITAEKRVRHLMHEQSALRQVLADTSPSAAAAVAAAAGDTEALRMVQKGGANARFPRTGGGTFVPIARVESPFDKRNGTPRQGGLVPSVRSRIVMDKRTAPLDSTHGITDYSHVWLIWEFHENTNVSGTVKAKVVPPRAGGARVGLYATRTPHRHNPIGMSLVELLSVSADGSVLTVGGADLLDGTPIYDIKPYISLFESKPHCRMPQWVVGDALPSDALPSDALLGAAAGVSAPGAAAAAVWASGTAWTAEADAQLDAIVASGAAAAAAVAAAAASSSKDKRRRVASSGPGAAAAFPCRFYAPTAADAAALRRTLTELCDMQDFRSQHQRALGATDYNFTFDGLRVAIVVEADTVAAPAAALAAAGAGAGAGAKRTGTKARAGAMTRSRSRAPADLGADAGAAAAAAAEEDDEGGRGGSEGRGRRRAPEQSDKMTQPVQTSVPGGAIPRSQLRIKIIGVERAETSAEASAETTASNADA